VKTKLTTDIERALFRYVREQSRINFIIGEVDIGPKWGIVDALQVTINKNKMTWKCYEIKVTKQDFYSKAKVTFVGHSNYYVMPFELYEQVKKDIPKEIGVYAYWSSPEYSKVGLVKNATKRSLGVPNEHLASRFITSSHRELFKGYVEIQKLGGTKWHKIR